VEELESYEKVEKEFAGKSTIVLVFLTYGSSNAGRGKLAIRGGTRGRYTFNEEKVVIGGQRGVS